MRNLWRLPPRRLAVTHRRSCKQCSTVPAVVCCAAIAKGILLVACAAAAEIPCIWILLAQVNGLNGLNTLCAHISPWKLQQSGIYRSCMNACTPSSLGRRVAATLDAKERQTSEQTIP